MTLQQKFDPLVPFVHLHIEEATPIQDAHSERAVLSKCHNHVHPGKLINQSIFGKIIDKPNRSATQCSSVKSQIGREKNHVIF